MESVPCYATVVMDAPAPATVYLIHAWIRGIHPMLWRRFLVRSDRTLADLHWILQIGFGWTDFHLHRFRIRKKSDPIPRIGSVEGHDARHVTLMDLQFRINERFLYE
ncbi:MAG: plasmid pRiA4b ORF-3 family protein, partial [Nitrospira sp.]